MCKGPGALKSQPYPRKRKKSRKLGRMERGMQPCICGGEYGFYSKCNRKLFESFRQGSDMI